MGGKVCGCDLNISGGVHAGGEGEMVGRDHDLAPGSYRRLDVLVERRDAIGKTRVRVAIDQRTARHGLSFKHGMVVFYSRPMFLSLNR